MEIGNKKESTWNKFKRVKFEISYIVPDDPEWIAEVEEFLREDVHSVIIHNEVSANIKEEDAPNATEDDIPDFMIEYMEDYVRDAIDEDEEI